METGEKNDNIRERPFNVIAAIGAELDSQRQQAENIPAQSGMFSVKTANLTIQEAANRPNPVPLWLTLWYQGEVCCLFADSNLGKSIYAVQIAAAIASVATAYGIKNFLFIGHASDLI